MRALIFFTLKLLLLINVMQPKKYLVEVDKDHYEGKKKVENKEDDTDNDEVATSTKKPVGSKMKDVMQGNSKVNNRDKVDIIEKISLSLSVLMHIVGAEKQPN